jgi:tannase
MVFVTRRVAESTYLTNQPPDLRTQQHKYNSTTNSWGLSINGMGAEFVTPCLQLRNTSTMTNLNGVTYDTLKGWIYQGMQTYESTLQTTWPDLTPFHEAGGKVLHFNEESDNSIPTASSVRYYESVRSIMYPNLSFNDSTAALNDWYCLFLVPGAGRCGLTSPPPICLCITGPLATK